MYYVGTSKSKQDCLTEEVNSWSSLWNEGAAPPKLVFGDVQRLPGITRDQVYKAARSFKAATCAMGGIHPKHLALLPAGAIDALIAIMETGEEAGALPAQAMQTFVCLIDKPTGGTRPIGLYQSVFRVWGKIRSVLIKEWESKYTNNLGFATDPGCSAIDVVWRHTLYGELAASSKQTFGCLQWDLHKRYELIDHHRLLEEAHKFKYPIGVLRATLASYRESRRILLGGIVSRPIKPERGIIAGSFAATTELRLLLLHVLHKHNRLFPTVHINVYIDDIALDVSTDCKSDTIAILSDAAASLARSLEDVHLPIAKHKSAVLSNSLIAATSLRRLMGDLGGPQITSVRSLGVDFNGGVHMGARQKAVRRERFRKLALRRPRLHSLRKTNPKVSGQVYVAGILPAVLYDSPVFGLFNRDLIRIRKETAGMLGISGPKKSIDLAFGFCSKKDPESISAGSVVRRFCKEVWISSQPREFRNRSAIPLGILVDGVKTFLEANPAPKKHASGPLSALQKCLHNAGWTVITPLLWQSRDAIEYNLTTTCPSRIANAFVSDLNDIIIHRAIVRLHMKYDSAATRELLDHGTFFKPLLDVANSMNAYDRRTLQAIVSNGIFTDNDLYSYGYEISPLRGDCGVSADTVYHRWFACPHVNEKARDALGTQLFNSILAEGSSSLRGTRCLFPFPMLTTTPLDVPVIEYINFQAGDALSPNNGCVYGDGSCFHSSHSPIARAGFAVVQLNECNEIDKAIYGSVPARFSQTAAVAEHMAFAVADDLGEAVVYAGDCQSVLDSFNHGLAKATAANNLHACSWRAMLRARGGLPPGVVSTVKIKAHKTLEDVEAEGGSTRHFWGNHYADQLAKKGAGFHDIYEGDIRLYINTRRDVKKLARYMVDTLKDIALTRIAQFGKVPRVDQGATLRTACNSTDHMYIWQDRQWICIHCLFRTISPSSVSRSKSMCSGISPFATFLGDSRGHKLWVSTLRNDTGAQILYCSDCWSYAVSSPAKSKLSQACRGQSVVIRPSVKFYLLKHKHPVTRVPFARPIRLQPSV